MVKIINKVQRKLKQINLLMYLICKAIRLQKTIAESNKILLFSGGGIGDAVLDASAWATLIDFYFVQGEKIYLAGPKANLNLLKRVLDNNKVTFIEAAIDSKVTKETMAEIFDATGKMPFDTIVARVHGNFWSYLWVNALVSKRKYAVLEQEILRSWRALALKLLPNRFTSVIVETLEMNERNALEQLLFQMGIKDYKMCILPLPEQSEFRFPQREYVTVAVDSRITNRRWPSDNFISLIQQLLDNYEYVIYITGSYLEPENKKLYDDTFRGNDRVINVIGKQSFEEWVELIRGAQFHIGVDSGSVHIASTVDTRAICLAGVWQGHRFFPYDMADSPNIKKPICVYRSDVDINSISCYNCAGKKAFGAGNKACRDQCEKGKPCQCLTAITVNDVITAIERARRDGMIN